VWFLPGHRWRVLQRVLNRPMSAHSTVMSPWSGKCSSHRFCTSRMRTSRDFCAASPATYKFLTGPCGVLPSKTTRANTLRQRQFRTKKQYCFPLLAVSPSFRTLAGIVVLCASARPSEGGRASELLYGRPYVRQSFSRLLEQGPFKALFWILLAVFGTISWVARPARSEDLSQGFTATAETLLAFSFSRHSAAFSGLPHA
jgi:hypothetical protein